jgi:hypothetical protein
LFTAVLVSVHTEAKSNPDHNHFRNPEELSDITDLSDAQCDLCGCYMGLEPNFDKNQIGLRYYTFKFNNEAAPATDDPLLDHDPEPGKASTEYYNNVELYGRIYINLKTRILFGMPFSFNEIDNKALNGVGDLRVLGQYNVYNTDIDGMTTFWQRVFLGGGLKFPTGVYNKQLVFGETEPHFQPGTGSLDFLFTGLWIAKLEKIGLGWRNDIVYTLNTANKNDYKFANRFNWASTFSFDIITSSVNILPKAGIYLETAKQDQNNGVDAEGSGGTVWMGTMGIDFTYNMFSVDFDYQLPISQNFIGVQPKNDYRFFVGMGYSF